MKYSLYIDTITEINFIKLEIRKGEKVIVDMRVEAKYAQAEKLLVSIENMLGENGLKLGDIERILVENKGEGFTALRIGVVTANALGYGLGIPVEGTDGEKMFKDDDYSVVKPNYTQEPNIT